MFKENWKNSEWFPLLVCLCFSIVLVIARLGAIFWQGDSHLVGGWNHPDNLGNQWLLVWVAERVREGQDIIHNDMYYLPVGDYPWIAGNGSEGFLYLPFSLLFSWPYSVMCYVFVLWVGIGCAGWFLGRASGLGRWNSLVPSMVLLSTPYLSRELNAGRFSQFDVLWIIASVASFLYLCRRPSIHTAIICGLFVGLTGIFYWYYAFFFVIFALITVGLRWMMGMDIPLGYIFIAALCSVLCVSPLLYIYWTHWNLIPGTQENVFPSPDSVADSLNFSWDLWRPYGRTAGMVQSLITSVLSMYCVYIAYKSRRTETTRARERQWIFLCGIVTLIVFWLLAYGPKLPFYGWVYGWTEATKRFWWPSRHLIMVNISFAILAGWGWQYWLYRKERDGDNSRYVYATMILVMLIPCFLWLQGDRPFHIFHTPIQTSHSVYTTLSTLEGDAIWQPPISPKIANSQKPLLQQLVHHKKMLQGHALWVDRVRPTEWDRMVQENSLLYSLQQYETADNFQIDISSPDIKELLEMGVAYIVLDRELFPKILPQIWYGYEQACRELFGKPVLQGDFVFVWSIENWTGVTSLELSRWTMPKGFVLGNGRHASSGELFPSTLILEHGAKP